MKKEGLLRVKELLKAKGLKQKEVAELMGMTETGFGIMIGQRGNPPLSQMMRLAEILGCSLRELFEKEEPEFTAYVDEGGKVRKFTSRQKLEDYINGKGEKD